MENKLANYMIVQLSYIAGCVDTIKSELEATDCISKQSLQNLSDFVDFVTREVMKSKDVCDDCCGECE